MNIVVLSPSLLGNASASGGDVSALGFLKNIAARHTLHVLAIDERRDPVASDNAIRDMQQWAASVRVIHLRMTPLRKLRAKVLKFFFIPKAVTRHSSGTFRRACREITSTYAIDLAVIQFPKMAQYVEEFPDIPTVMDVQDAYSVSVFRNYLAASSRCFLARFYAFRTWYSWLRYERHYYKKFAHLFVVSEQDDYGLRLFNPALKTTVLPRVMSLSSASCASEDPAFHIGFIGSFSHKPNLTALRFLFDSVLPLLTRDLPDLRVLIAGKDPPKEIAEGAPACVTFAGFIPSVEDFYRQITIVVAPVITGGGVKIKVIEGLLTGLPVVTTSIGAEGIDLTDGINVIIADNAPSFAHAILELLRNAPYRSEVGAAGRKHALDTVSPQRHSELVDRVFQSILKPT